MSAIKEFNSWPQVAPGLTPWQHGRRGLTPRPFRIAPFWYGSICIRRKWNRLGRVSQASIELFGPTSTPYIYQPDGETELIGVAFEPELSLSLVGLRSDEYQDLRRELRDREICRNLANVLGAAEKGQCPEMVHKSLLFALQVRVEQAYEQNDQLAESLYLIRKHHGQLKIADLARSMNTSDRHIRRLFNDHLGCQAKFYTRLVRLGHLLSDVDHVSSPQWAFLAAAHGLVDQAHLNYEFRQLLQDTPSNIASERQSGVSDFSKTSVPVSDI